MNRKYLLLRITIAITTVAFGLVPSGGRFAAVSGEHEDGESQTPGSRLPNLKAPAGELPDTRHVVVDEFDGAVIPSGRFITPAGVEVNVGAPKPFGMALSPDGNTLATINSGIGPFSISLISDLKTPVPAVTLVNVNATFMGIAFSSDSSRFYASGGENGNVWVGDTAVGKIIGSVNLNGPTHPLTGPLDVTTNPPGRLRVCSQGLWFMTATTFMWWTRAGFGYT